MISIFGLNLIVAELAKNEVEGFNQDPLSLIQHKLSPSATDLEAIIPEDQGQLKKFLTNDIDEETGSERLFSEVFKTNLLQTAINQESNQLSPEDTNKVRSLVSGLFKRLISDPTRINSFIRVRPDQAKLLLQLDPDSELSIDVAKHFTSNGISWNELPEKLQNNKSVFIEDIIKASSPANTKTIKQWIEKNQARDQLSNQLIKIYNIRKNIGVLIGNEQEDKDFAKTLISRNGQRLQDLPDKFKNDKKMVYRAVAQNGLALKHTSDELKNNSEIVYRAVQQNGHALQHASQEMKNEKLLAKAAINQTPYALQWVGLTLKSTFDIASLAIKQNPTTIKFVPTKHPEDYIKLAELAISSKPLALKHLHQKFKNNNDLVMKAVEKNGMALEYASKRIRLKKSKIIMEALRNNREARKYVDPDVVSFYLNAVDNETR